MLTAFVFCADSLSFVLYFQSPDGYTVASAAGDETLRFWQVFGAPDVLKRTKSKEAAGPFNKYLTHIR